MMSNNLIQMLLIISLLSVAVGCNGIGHDEINFPDDGIYRYLVLQDFNSSEITFFSIVYVYNLDLHDDADNDIISSFVKYYHESKNLDVTKIRKRHGHIKIISSVEDFDLAPHYYDDADWDNINNKVVYDISTELSLDVGSKVQISKIKKNGVAIDIPLGMSTTSSNNYVFKKLDVRRWKDVDELSKQAWKSFQTNIE
jgi:hypothetical protein